MVYKEFVKKIVDKIKEKGLTLKEVAKYSGIDVSYLSRILTGKRNPPYDENVIRKIAKILGIDEDELVFSAGKIPKKYQQYFSSKEDIEKILSLLKNKKYLQQRQRKVAGDKKVQDIESLSISSVTPEELL